MNDLIKHCNCLPQQKSKEFGDHSPYCVYIVLAKMQEKIEKLEAKLSDQRKNRIATIDVVQESYELKDRIDEFEAEVQELRHKSISDHATIVVLESLIAGIDPDLLDPKEAVCWEELHKKYYPEHYGR